MKILLVDVYRDVYREGTTVSRVLVEEGSFRPIKKVTGSFGEQVEAITLLVLKERPQKVIVDESGLGHGLLDYLRKTMTTYGLTLMSDATIVYG